MSQRTLQLHAWDPQRRKGETGGEHPPLLWGHATEQADGTWMVALTAADKNTAKPQWRLIPLEEDTR